MQYPSSVAMQGLFNQQEVLNHAMRKVERSKYPKVSLPSTLPESVILYYEEALIEQEFATNSEGDTND